MNLSQIKTNIIYEIVGYNVLNSRRYFELGFMLKSKIKLIKFSILKKSMIVCVDGVNYSMRTSNAKDIEVKEV